MAEKKFPTGDIRALSEDELLAIIARGNQPGPGFWDTLGDVGKSGAVGVGEAGIGIAGLPGDVESLARMGAEKIAGGPSNIIPPQQLPTSGAVRQAVEGWTGPFYEPQTPAGKVARSIGEQAPGVLFPGGPVRKAVNVLAPAFGAEAAEKVAGGESSTARLVGTLAGGMAGARGITPAPASPERARLGAVLQAEGVPLTAGQRTGNRPLMWFEQAAADTPFAAGRAADLNTTQKEAFTRGALRRVGEDARRVTPEVMDRALTRMGAEFDRLAAIHAMPLDSALMQDLAQIGRRYAMEVTPDKQARVIEATIADINGLAARMPAAGGQVYANLRTQLDRTARRTQDGELRATIQEIRHAMDDAIERGMQITGRTQDLDAWRQVRRQYRNFIPIEKAATGAGSETAEGLLSPSQLRAAVVSEHGRRNYARGQGDLAEYARAAEALMKPLPQSGTAPRQAAGNLFASMAGGLVGHTATGDVSGTLAGMMLPAAAGRAALSGPMQAYLGNQLLPMTRAEMYRRLLAQQLLARPEEERLGVAPDIAPPPLLGVADRDLQPRLGVSR